MARKNKRLKTEYYRGLGFDLRKYITAPVQHHTTEYKPQRGDIWFADLGSHPDQKYFWELWKTSSVAEPSI